MKKESQWLSLTISILSLIVSVATLLLTSPLIVDTYLSPKLTYTVSELSDGALRLDLENTGKRHAANVVIEISPRQPDSYKNLSIRDVSFIPPKEYEIVSQGSFSLIKLKTPIYKQEQVAIFVHADIPKEAYNFLWVRVTYDQGEAIRKE